MLRKEQLLKIASRTGYKLDVIEKDYAITWVLKAIYDNPKLHKYLVFKGGTCLSKVYVKNYRLSEDLDFTTYKEGKLSLDDLQKELEAALEKANQDGGPQLSLKRDDTHANPGMTTFQVRFTGPLGGQGRIKLEIKKLRDGDSNGEHVTRASAEEPLIEDLYPDVGSIKIHCYALYEVLLEKLRATMQRGKSRDYYDLWQILSRKDLLSERKDEHGLMKLRHHFAEKCLLSGVPYEPEKIFDRKQLAQAKPYWTTDLAQLARNLPDFEEVMAKLREMLFDEDQLARFAETLDPDNLLNIARRDARSPVLQRGIQILALRLASRKRIYVLTAIKSTSAACNANDELRDQLKKQLAPALTELEKDGDKDLRRAATELLNEMNNRTPASH